MNIETRRITEWTEFQKEWSWNKVTKTFGLQGRCIAYVLYTYTPHVLHVTLRKRVTHNIIGIICNNIPYENINNIPDLKRMKTKRVDA